MASLKEIKQLALEESKNYQLKRSSERQTQLGEVFTPTPLVIDILKKLPPGQVNGVWSEDKTFLDPACGNGQFLAVIAIIKTQLGHKDPLSTIYGVDIMEDNVLECRQRLLAIAGDNAHNRKVVEKNIVCANSLIYDFEFKEPYWKGGR